MTAFNFSFNPGLAAGAPERQKRRQELGGRLLLRLTTLELLIRFAMRTMESDGQRSIVHTHISRFLYSLGRQRFGNGPQSNMLE